MRPGIGALLYASSLLAHKGGKNGERPQAEAAAVKKTSRRRTR
jgi:hypothetical protein